MGVAHIVIVEDTLPIAELVSDHLSDAGHRTEIIGDGREAAERFRRDLPDVVVLDVMLPGQDGLQVCEAIRASDGTQPIVVMLTARQQEDDAMAGYRAGADDYVRKPFGVQELVARIGALLALAQRRQPAQPAARDMGGLALDVASRQVHVNGVELRLAPMEFDLLARLCRAPGEVLDRALLLEEVWGYEHAGYARTVDSHVTRLRRKLSNAQWSGAIATVHGVGYRLEPPGAG